MIKLNVKALGFFYCLAFLACFTSCVSYKNVPYFQDIDSSQVISAATFQIPKIQKHDLLGIYINSEGNDASATFGTPTSEANAAVGTNHGYLVDDNGDVQLNTLGKIRVLGLTTDQVQALLTEKSAVYVKNPNVVVRVLNFKVSVTGDVNNSGYFTIANGKINVLEAITMAGDMKYSAKREKVLVFRESGEGQKSVGRLDMRSKKIFTSPYFYLKNNDLVYVEPDLAKANRDQILRNVGWVASFTGVLVLILTRTNRL